MKKNIYICYTKYQLLITLLKLDINLKNDLCLLFDLNRFQERKIKLSMNVNHIMYVGDYTFSIFNIKKIIKNYKIISSYTDIFIFLDHRIIGHFLNKFKFHYYLIEDGYNFYSLEYKKTIIYNNPIKKFLYNLFMNPPKRPGDSNYVLSIEVNDKSILSNKDRRYDKMVEVPRKELFNNIDETRKKVILDVFDVKPMKYIKDKQSLLILTQPLYQDKFDQDIINTEDDQLKFYSDIVSKYKKDYEIYIKVHPRDKVDYHSLNADVVFLDKDVPMELYEFVGDYEFDIGVTHSSTALDYLSCVKEKIFLKDLKAK